MHKKKFPSICSKFLCAEHLGVNPVNKNLSLNLPPSLPQSLQLRVLKKRDFYIYVGDVLIQVSKNSLISSQNGLYTCVIV